MASQITAVSVRQYRSQASPPFAMLLNNSKRSCLASFTVFSTVSWISMLSFMPFFTVKNEKTSHRALLFFTRQDGVKGAGIPSSFTVAQIRHWEAWYGAQKHGE